jgi:subtilisin family serine protease
MISRRSVRIAAIALVLFGTLALSLDRAGAQLGVDLLRQAIDKGKAKVKQVPGKAPTNILKGKQPGSNLKGQITKGGQFPKGQFPKGQFPKGQFQKGQLTKSPLTKDGIGKAVKGKGGLEKFTKDRLPKDKAKDLIARDKFGKDRLTKDKLSKGPLSKDKLGKSKLGKDKLGKDQLAKDKLGKGKLAQDKLGKDKLGKDKLGKGKLAQDKLGKDKLGKNNLGKAGDLKSGKGKAIPDRRAVTRIANAKTHIERGKIRVDHRRQINVARLRLPPRPFPGAANFTGVPPASETRFVATEMVFHVGPNVSRQTVDATAKRLGLTVVGAQTSGITGGTLYHFGLPPGRRVPDVVRSLESERVGIASPNYVYRIVQDTASDTQSAAGSPDQYTVEKLRLAEVHKTTTGREVLVAVIDSKVDANHPDLAGAIVEHYDAVGKPEQAHSHGTGMAGAIASHRKLLGIAPGARILAVHAFSTSSRQSPEATTRQIIAGIEWAIGKGARVINMSFAGPYDPMIQLAMRNAAAKGVILIAASGNMGAKSPPLYPAADPHVIAVTATDEADQLFTQAVRGPHLAVAAPGVDVAVPAPGDTYQLTTGTSVAAAHVSGVAALLLERHPSVDARTVLEVLTSTARNLNPKGRDDLYGWGLIDPASALQELDSRVADGKLLATSVKSAPPKAAAAKSTSGRPSSPTAASPRPASVGQPNARPAPSVR